MPNDAAKFYKRSFCDKDLADEYTLMGDFTNPANALDRNLNTYAITSGKNSDSSEAEFIIEFDEEPDIDTIALLGNLKTFSIYTWDGTRVDTAQVNTITGAAIDALEYEITINSTTWVWTITPDNMAASYEALLSQINAALVPVTATYINAGDHSAGLYVTADVAGFPFTMTLGIYGGGNEGPTTPHSTIYTENVSVWIKNKDYTGNTSEFIIDELTTHLTETFIKLSCTATITANQEKWLKELVLTSKIGELIPTAITTAEDKYKRFIAENLNGGSVQLVFNPLLPKFHCVMNFKNMLDDFSDYQDIKAEFLLDSCIVYLYLSDDNDRFGIGALYLVNDISNVTYQPTNPAIPNGFSGSMELLEL